LNPSGNPMTNKPRQIEWLVLCLLIVFLAVGCAHEVRQIPQKEEAPPAPAPSALSPQVSPPAPSPGLRVEGLDQRIIRVQALLESDQLSFEDRLLAQDLLKAYQTMERVSSASPTDEQTRDLIELLASNLIQMDEHYFKKRPPPEEEARLQAIALFAGKRKSIMDSYLAGDYQSVIEGCIDLEKVLGPDSLTPEIGLVFAISLGKRGMIEEALRVGTKISDDLERKPGFIQLRAKMIEWQLALGDRKSAIESYEKLLDNMHEREAVLKVVELNLSGQGPPKALSEKKEEPPPPVDLAKEPTSVQEVLRQVDALVQKSDFETAKLLLLRLRIRLQEGPDAELVDQAMKSVELAEENSRKEQKTEAAKNEEALEVAANLIEQERYEEAIAELENLKQGAEMSPEAKQLQDLAVEKIINRERNKAAKLFLMARNTTDPAKKEELLNSSYNILKALVDKYPSSPLYQKINDNIKRIEDELSKLKTSSPPSPGGRG
jgi:tetratricopeptide (TPR) repeat protein